MRTLSLAALAAAAFLLAAPAQARFADEPALDPGVLSFAKAIAVPTAQAGGPGEQKLVLFGNSDRGVVVTGIDVVLAGQPAEVPAGAIGLLLVQPSGRCGPPHGQDAAALRDGLTLLVASPSGQHLWRIARHEGVLSIALVSGRGGPWEPFQADPKAYRTYKCSKYK